MTDDTRLSLSSADFDADRLAQLKALFPEAFPEGAFDVDRLRHALGDIPDTGPERYGLSWAGKADAERAARIASTATLVPVPDESVHFDTTENLILEGDNLEILKLLQASYHRKVKMIYIDPPYNTGHDFIYPDNFRDGLQQYLRFTGQVNGEGVKMVANTEENGRFHSNWLSMMYPRLTLSKALLRDDGVIFVSIDDHEVHNLRILMNAIFGEENFVASLVWFKKLTGGYDNDRVNVQHDYILIYTKSITNFDTVPEVRESGSGPCPVVTTCAR